MRSNENCKINFEDADKMYQATRTLLPTEDGSMDHGVIIGAYLGWALDEIERLQARCGSLEKVSKRRKTKLDDLYSDLMSAGRRYQELQYICDDQANEIERLRAEAKDWQCEYPCSEEKWCTRQNLCARMKSLDNAIDEDGCITIRNQAKRIEKLEAALIEERAGQTISKFCNCNNCWPLGTPKPESRIKAEENARRKAREQLHTEGLL